MKIPHTLKIGAHLYTLKFVSEGMDDAGQTDRAKNEIILNSSYPEDQLEATLIHEIFHAINNELNHVILDSLAEQFYAVLHENNLLR